MLAVIIALQHWDVYLRGSRFLLRTDHETIRYLQSKQNINCRQAGWLDLLQSYCLEVEQIAGKENIFPDAMSRRPDHAPSVKSIRLRDENVAERSKVLMLMIG